MANNSNTTNKKRVYLNEFNVLLSNTAYLPLASGLIQAYAQSKPEIKEHYEFMPIVYKRDLPRNIMPLYDDPSVAAFSVCSWNEQLCLQVARKVKELFPECLIVFGGPQVPFDAEQYFNEHDFLDVAVRGEGERAFAQVLERFAESRNFSGIPGISYRDPAAGCYRKNDAEQPPLHNNELDVFPSPYLEGVFDDFMTMDMKWQAVIETNRGCPFPCAYCFWGQAGLNNKFRYFSLDRVAKEIEWCAKHDMAYLFCADSNFGMLDRDKEVVSILINTKERYGYPERFRVNWGKNTDDRIFSLAKLLHDHELEKAITISFQTFNETALANVNRKNIKLSTFENLQSKYAEHNVPTYSEMILGLPGETYDSWIDGLEKCLTAGIKNNVFIYLCQVLPNTFMARAEYLKKYGIQTVRAPLNEGHGAIHEPSEVVEYEDVIIETSSMSMDEWRRAVVFSWVLQAFVALKLGFFLLIYLKNKYDMSYSDIIAYVSDARFTCEAPTIRKNVDELWNFAKAITNGAPKTVEMEDYGNIYWEPEEAFYFKIMNNKDEFYAELKAIIHECLETKGIKYDETELDDIIKYQKIRLPQFTEYESMEESFRFNVSEYYDDYFSGETAELRRVPQRLRLKDIVNFNGDRKAFAREILVYGRKGNKLINQTRWGSDDSSEWRDNVY